MTGATPAADLILRGGSVLVLDDADTRAQAIAVHDGRILAVGSDAEIDAFAGPRTAVVELRGRAVIPGINDAHLHASWLGALWPRTLFGGAEGAQAAGALVRTDEERRAALLHAGELLASLGITSYTEPGIGPGEDEGPTGSFGSAVLRLYRELDAAGLLRQRVNLLLLFGLIDGPSRVEDLLAGIRTADTATPHPERFRIAGVKVFADGIPPMRNAFIHGHYLDGSHGDLLLDGADEAAREAHLKDVVRAGHRAGLQVAVHATGDRAIDAVIDAVLEAQAAQPADLRHYVVHGDLLAEQSLDRLVEAGMGVTLQAGIADLTRDWLGGTLEADRVAAAWPLQAMLDAGVPLTLSSDAPVLAPDWRVEIAAADRLMGEAPDPQARLHTLLRAYTAVPAWQDHAEQFKGTLEPGKVADLVVLDASPYDVGATGVPGLQIERTYLGGELVFDRAAVASTG